MAGWNALTTPGSAKIDNVEIVATPEPAVAALCAPALGLLARRRRV